MKILLHLMSVKNLFIDFYTFDECNLNIINFKL